VLNKSYRFKYLGITDFFNQVVTLIHIDTSSIYTQADNVNPNKIDKRPGTVNYCGYTGLDQINFFPWIV